MQISVLGTGVVGRSLAGRLTELGHDVMIGTRDVAATMSRTAPDSMGTPPFATWAQEHENVIVGTLPEAAAYGELVIVATAGAGAINALTTAGATNLAGKVVMDVSNPLDFSRGFPPTLLVRDTDSLAEQIQAAFPQARVVKTLNTMNASLMVNPRSLAGGDHSVFVSGNDAAAKATVTELLHDFGHSDVIDLGDITTARGPEMVLPIWVRLMTALGTPTFNFKIVRNDQS